MTLRPRPPLALLLRRALTGESALGSGKARRRVSKEWSRCLGLGSVDIQLAEGQASAMTGADGDGWTHVFHNGSGTRHRLGIAERLAADGARVCVVDIDEIGAQRRPRKD